MISSFLLVVFALGVALPPTEACTYWCMNPVTRGYECCDDGNPWYTQEDPDVKAPVDAEFVEVETPTEGVDNIGSSGCRYYCVYNNESYCCDIGENAIPDDHEDHAGRCPTEEEQSCKVSTGDKKPVGKTTKTSNVFVDKHDKMCASDGYCGEEERCCPNKCHKIHTCVPSL